MSAQDQNPTTKEYPPFVALVVETLKELGAVFMVDGELIEPETEENQEGEE